MQLNTSEILSKYWGYSEFRTPQEDIINNVLNGKDTLALLPTGGGKSICFQVPALAKQGVCIVVSPLIALIKDQVENLQKKDIPALMIYSGMSFRQVENILKLATTNEYKFLYLSPERLETKQFLEYLPAIDVSLIAVDESHCISQWGYDFRPPYLRIAALREHFPTVPVIALTASATPIVQQDICEKLQFKDYKIFQKSFKRENLSYSVFNVASKINKTVEILNAVQGTAIVYCKSRRRTVEIAELLNYYKLKASYYHAGLTNEQRSERQQDWIENKTRIMVCTNAFGMGIDKPDVRVVIHYDVPDCLENYYQEAGRAGRDGNKAYAVLLYYSGELEQLEDLIEQRYPPTTVIKDIYLSICQYLELGVNEGKGEYFDFDLKEFCAQFKVPILLAHNALRILEQEEFISYNESVFMPSTIQVTASRAALRQIEESNNVEDELVKILLRTYSGILTNTITVSEKNIAYLLKWNVEDVKTKLGLLHKKNVIEYEPAKTNPQIFFVSERVEAYSFKIEENRYWDRKASYANKIKKICKFVLDNQLCRSAIISKYFGAEDEASCGKCDNCLQRYKAKMGISKKEALVQEILQYVRQHQTVAINAMRNKYLSTENATEAQLAIDLLLAEELIVFRDEKYIAK